jgi:hypothetical protein
MEVQEHSEIAVEDLSTMDLDVPAKKSATAEIK